MVFITFFPKLLAGPIVYHREMLPSISPSPPSQPDFARIRNGLFLISIGLMKKVILADTFAVWANKGFSHADSLGLTDAWVASLSYTFQLYFDFSGYTDIALDTAMLFMIKLPFNFNSPYKSLDIAAIMITFLLAGLWHGASWNFVFWGGLHGAALDIYRIWKRFGLSLPKPFAWFTTFMFINAAWVFFRAGTFSDALHILKAMTALGGFGAAAPVMPLVYIAVCTAAALQLQNSDRLARHFGARNNSLYITLSILVLCLLQVNQTVVDQMKAAEFLYFNF
jgi:alginate O-acetyltransferase complex protein AlgI